MTGRVTVAMGCDESMAMPCAITLSTALDSLAAGVSLSATIVSENISDGSKRRFQHLVDLRNGPGIDHQVRFLIIEEKMLGKLPEVRHLSRATYLRLLLPLLLPDTSRIVYLDSDLLVQRDLSELFSIDLGGYPLAAVPSLWGERLSDQTALGYCVEEESFSRDALYFQAGVMLMNLALWRAECLSESMFAFLERNSNRLLNADQDAINAVAAGRIMPLDIEWNLVAMPPCYQKSIRSPDVKAKVAALLSGTKHAQVLWHFAGRHKPWGTAALTHSFAAYYAAAARRSGWFGSVSEYYGWRLKWFTSNIAGVTKRAIPVKI